MKEWKKILLRVSVFGLIVIIIGLGLNSFFQPYWSKWNNYYTTRGFYEQPKNTIETIYLGPSTIVRCVAPTQLYEQYGICAYNLATEQQPVLGSYYWAQEAYRLHGETLKTVFFDVSALRSISKDSFYHKSIDTMRLSPLKIKAAYEHCDGNLQETISFLVPLISYHGRWSALEPEDFTKYELDKNNGTRGYHYVRTMYINTENYKEDVHRLGILDEKAELEELLEESLEYFDRLVTFCEEKGLELVLMKSPALNWSSSLHNSVAELADSYGLEFLDFNYGELYKELMYEYGYVHEYDTTDGKHMNHVGGVKFTRWMGDYITENLAATDVRGKPEFAFMEDELSEYNETVGTKSELYFSSGLTEYLSHAIEGENTIFITVKDDAAKGLTDEQREYFASVGLEALSEIGYGDSYIGVIENGQVKKEKLGYFENDEDYLYHVDTLPNGDKYRLKSGRDISSCLVEGEEMANDDDGINIVVYNNPHDMFLYNTAFDTGDDAADRNRYTDKVGQLITQRADIADYAEGTYEWRILSHQAMLEELIAQGIPEETM